jgi:hypothetical protein
MRREEYDDATAPSTLTLFDRDFRHHLDTGLNGVLVSGTLDVYDHMRRLIWRSARSTGCLKTDALHASGHVLTMANNEALRARTGLSKRSVCYAVSDLEALSWIQRSDVSSTPSYILGKRLTVEKKVPRPLKIAMAVNDGDLFADLWRDKLYAAMHEHAVRTTKQAKDEDWLLSENYGGLSWDARRAFCIEYILKHAPGVRYSGDGRKC